MICTPHRGSCLTCAHLTSSMHVASVTLRLRALHFIQLPLLLIHLQPPAVPPALLPQPWGSSNTAYFAKKEMDSTDESYLPTGCEPKNYDLMETCVESLTECLTKPHFLEQRFLEDVDYDDAALEEMLKNAHREHVYHSQREGLSVGQSSSSVSERTMRPVVEGTGRLVVANGLELNIEHAQIRTILDRKSDSLPTVRRRLRNTNSRLIMAEVVFKNWVKLLNLSRKNFIALKQKNFNDEINNFFMNGYCSKIRNYVKLVIKVSKNWKNWRRFRVPPSTQLQDEDESRIRTLFWNLLVRYRNCGMKLIAFTTFTENFVVCCNQLTKILHEVRLRQCVFCTGPL